MLLLFELARPDAPWCWQKTCLSRTCCSFMHSVPL